MLIKVNDTVEVISGRDKGQRGRILKVDRTKGKVVVEGLNRVYKHVKRSQRNPQGGRLSKEAFIDVSKVMIVCPTTGKPITGRNWADASVVKMMPSRRDSMQRIRVMSGVLTVGMLATSFSPLPTGGEGLGVRGQRFPKLRPLTPGPSPPLGRGENRLRKCKRRQLDDLAPLHRRLVGEDADAGPVG